VREQLLLLLLLLLLVGSSSFKLLCVIRRWLIRRCAGCMCRHCFTAKALEASNSAATAPCVWCSSSSSSSSQAPAGSQTGLMLRLQALMLLLLLLLVLVLDVGLAVAVLCFQLCLQDRVKGLEGVCCCLVRCCFVRYQQRMPQRLVLLWAAVLVVCGCIGRQDWTAGAGAVAARVPEHILVRDLVNAGMKDVYVLMICTVQRSTQPVTVRLHLLLRLMLLVVVVLVLLLLVPMLTQHCRFRS
jgi:hypothetical protein